MVMEGVLMVTLYEHVALLSLSSVAVQVRVCVPGASLLAAAGDREVEGVSQLSEAVGVALTIAPQSPASEGIGETGAVGQVIVGSVSSSTTRVKTHVAELSEESVTVQV